MKKFIYAISALAVMFAASCSKDDSNAPAEYQVVVNMDKPSFGEGVRAARTTWENGDVVYINFNADINNGEKYLTLTYNAGSWTPNWVGTTAANVVAAGNGTLSAGYTNGTFATNYPMYFPGKFLYCRTTEASCVMACENGKYTVSGNTITLDITMVPKCAQVTVRGLQVEDNWTLQCDCLVQVRGFSLSAATVGTANGDENGSLAGFANADGVSFYGNNNMSSPEDITFTLTNGVKTYTRTFTNKTLAKGDAIIMDGPSTSTDWEELIK